MFIHVINKYRKLKLSINIYWFILVFCDAKFESIV